MCDYVGLTHVWVTSYTLRRSDGFRDVNLVLLHVLEHYQYVHSTLQVNITSMCTGHTNLCPLRTFDTRVLAHHILKKKLQQINDMCEAHKTWCAAQTKICEQHIANAKNTAFK